MTLNQRIEEWLKDTTQKLNINGLNLTECPEQLIGKENLIKTLSCSSNRLVSLPNNLTNLKTLSCSDNKLVSLPNNLTNLKTLSCSDNKLASLPNNLTKLEKLGCYNNQLASLPNNLTKLKRLICSYNRLTLLPNNLTNLKTLECLYNQLTSLPNNLTKLKRLYCWNNQLFSNEFGKWKKIWRISIRHQHILQISGIKRVVKILKNRSYLPRLNELHNELIWSPNHPGKFFTSLPRVGHW